MTAMGYPERTNCAVTLLDQTVADLGPNRPCITADDATWTYGELLKKLKDHHEEFVTTTVELDLEALEKLDDDELAMIGAERVATEKVTVKRAQVDMGKAANPATVKAPKAKKGQPA